MPPAVAGDLVFVGSCSGTFFALDARTGDPRWSYDVRQDGKQGSFHGRIHVEKDRVFFDTDLGCTTDGIGHAYAADRATGRILWKYKDDVGVSSNLVRTPASICFGTTAGEWGCLDPLRGKLRWKVEAPGGPHPCEFPTWADTDGQRLIVITPDGAVMALRASNGRTIWKRRLAGKVTTAPLIADGVIYVGAADNRVYALKTSTGVVLRSATVPGKPATRLALKDRRLFLLLEGGANAKGGIAAIDVPTLKPLWSRDHARAFASEEPHVWRDIVIAGDCAGGIYAFSLIDGKPAWQINVGGCIRSISSSSELLFIGGQEGVVSALRP